MLVSDSRSAVNVDLIPDARATHYWDGDRVLGIWFAEQEEYKSATFGPIAWDTYFLYSPDARWEEVPKPLMDFGRTVISKSKDLERSIVELLTPN